jgi:hypothetical protein
MLREPTQGEKQPWEEEFADGVRQQPVSSIAVRLFRKAAS